MHIGMIVGIGPAATDFYYRYLIAALARAGHDLDLSMAHADAPTLLRNQAESEVALQVEIYARLANRLRATGAQVLAITSIAGHFCVNEFKRISPLPIIDLLDEVRTEIGRRGLSRLGLIGTRRVMMSRFYDAIPEATVTAPSGDLLSRVHDAYVAMATSGRVTEEQRETFFAAGKSLVEQRGCEIVMLGGTDLALAFGDHDPGFPTLDCAQVHADAIAKAATQ
jgi:aspartate racemase